MADVIWPIFVLSLVLYAVGAFIGIMCYTKGWREGVAHGKHAEQVRQSFEDAIQQRNK